MTKFKYHTISSATGKPRRRRPVVKFLKQSGIVIECEDVQVKKCDSSASISSTDSNSYDWEERRKTISSNLKRKLGSGKKRPCAADAFSGVNMKEAFICSFPDGTEEVACAQRGRTLREMLSPIFDRRKLSMQEYAVFLQQSNTPLSYSFDTHPLAGMTLLIQRDHYDATNEFTYKVKDSPTSLPRPIRFKDTARSLHDELPDSPALAHQTMSGEKNSFKRSNSLELDESQISGIRRTPSDKSDGDLDPILRETSKKSCRGKKNLSLYLAGGDGDPKPNAEDIDIKAKSITEQLERYGLYGLTQFDKQFDNVRENFNIELESNWQDIVSVEAQNILTTREKEQQEAIWELFSTEHNYLNNLSTCVQTFLNCLRKLKHEQFLSDINVEDLFLNIELIYEINLKFWKDCLEPCLNQARTDNSPLNPHLITEGYVFEDRFHPYLEYCMKHQERVAYLDGKMKKHTDFKEYISWCENQLRSTTRLGLKDMLVKPFQRITKYQLLLKCILKKTDDDDHYTALKSMLDKVIGFVQSLNRQMQEQEEQRSLKDIMSKIDGYNVFTPPNSTHSNDKIDQIISQYNRLDLLSPVPVLGTQRRFLGESSSKMITDRPFECHLFLFTDMLLVAKGTKKRDKKYTIVKQPLAVDPDKLKVTELEEHQNSLLMVYLNEFGAAIDYILLQSPSREAHLSFLNSIKEAQDKFREQKIKKLLENDSKSNSNISIDSVSNYSLTSPDQHHLRLGCSITRSSSENYNRRTIDNSTSVSRAQSMPASNEKRLHNDASCLASSSASSSETSGSMLSVDSSAKSSSIALSEIKENDYMASDLSIQNVEDSADENTVISEKCEKYDDNRTDNYISDNLCSDLQYKIDIDKTVLVPHGDNDITNQDIYNLSSDKL